MDIGTGTVCGLKVDSAFLIDLKTLPKILDHGQCWGSRPASVCLVGAWPLDLGMGCVPTSFQNVLLCPRKRFALCCQLGSLSPAGLCGHCHWDRWLYTYRIRHQSHRFAGVGALWVVQPWLLAL